MASACHEKWNALPFLSSPSYILYEITLLIRPYPAVCLAEDTIGIREVNAANIDTNEALSWQSHSARPRMVLCTESHSSAPKSTLKLVTHCRYERRTD